jgi:hypothetical protein
MAMNYQNFASLGVNLNRQKYGPLDISNVFTSAADLKYYLTKGTFTEGVSEYWYKNANDKIVPYPYEGQVLATVIDGVVNVYALALDAEGNFTTQEIGAKVEVDGKTIKLNDGKLELVGLPTDAAGKTYVPSYVNGVLTWAEPDTSTAEGQAQEIEGLKTRAKALEDTVNGTADTEGLVAKVAALEAVDNATQAELDAYKEVVTSAIAAGVKEAKDYADAQDADTIYNDSELRGRIEIIEGDYLKEADKYDDTAVKGRLDTAESKISSLEESVGDASKGLTKAIADEKARAEAAEKALGERIDAIDFIDGDELDAAMEVVESAANDYTDEQIAAIEEAISKLNHFTTKIVTSVDDVTETGVLYLIKDESVEGIDKYNEYIVVDGTAVLIGDTTTDLSNYYNKSEIDSTVEAIEEAIADEVDAREALAEEVEALKAIDNATQAELDAYKEVVTSAIATAKSEAIADADGKLTNKVNTSDFETFKGENTTAIGTAKQEAIDAAAQAVEAKGYAVATEVAGTYATKSALTEAVEGIENDLLAYAKTADVNAELAKKIETGSIAHSSESLTEGVTVDGTKLNIVVDAYTKQETRDYVADVIEDMTGGESAADVLLALNNHLDTYNEKVGQIDAKDAAQDTAIAAAKAQADKGVEDAATVAGDLVTANLAIADNTREIGVAKSSIETVNTTLTGKITALENADTTIKSDITTLQGVVTGEGGHASRLAALEGRATNLEARDTELAALIQANTDKFAGYYTKDEVDSAVQGAIDAIPDVDLDPYAKTADVNAALALKANAADVYTKGEADAAFMTQTEVDDRINALIIAADPEGGKTITDIQNLVKYVDENAGEIAGLVTTVEGHTDTIGQHTTAIANINDTIAAIVQPRASKEITVAEDGTLGIGEVSTDKLVQGNDTLVLSGGSAK